ncbi:type II toxin-antitoxin system RelE/ParE family toxin [Rhizobium ruizarguesonis]
MLSDYIAKDNPCRALSLVQELRARCEGLSDIPLGLPLVLTLPRYERHGIRRRVHGNYLIFYRVDGEKVVVIHILHGVMDYASILIEP